jgi:hypothetical protein
MLTLTPTLTLTVTLSFPLGTFDLTYVICPISLEHDELDLLTGPTYACFAQGIPPALRKKVLGESYLTKLAESGVKLGEKERPGSSKAKKGGDKAPPKGKEPKAGAKKAADGQSAGVNPFVYDPDGIVATPVSDVPLVLGAFTISPRIGIVQPGQAVGIDMVFDPRVGSDLARERLRFCISGADDNDISTKLISQVRVRVRVPSYIMCNHLK